MKITKKRTAKLVEKTTKLKLCAGQPQVGKSIDRTRGRCPKPAGKSKELVVKKDEHSLPLRSVETLRPPLLDKNKCSAETKEGLPISEQQPGPTLHTSVKVKLQLFPNNEVTCQGLEKDGYHPYLELTLSARKKISSVLKHLNNKWGGSRIAIGEPVLFPYTISEDLAGYRWTLNDVGLSAGDVYESIGRPSIFRLRYGWFSDCENNLSGVPSTSTPFEVSLQFEGTQKGGSSNIGSVFGKEKQIEVTNEDLKAATATGAAAISVTDKTPSNGLTEPMCNEVKMHHGMCQSSYPWDDGLTNISIGGLLSEASLQGRFNNCDPKSDVSNAGLHPSQLTSDSFDAFIMAHVNHSQAPKLPSHGASSSILDAEDTCHAFPFQKFSSSGKDALNLGGSAYARTCSQDAVSKSFKHPMTSEVNIQSGLPQGNVCQESKTDLSLCSQFYNDESSLGLSGIKWTDSLGPFDLGLSSSKRIISSDSLSISRIVS